MKGSKLILSEILWFFETKWAYRPMSKRTMGIMGCFHAFATVRAPEQYAPITGN